jgi:hypothetical protein
MHEKMLNMQEKCILYVKKMFIKYKKKCTKYKKYMFFSMFLLNSKFFGWFLWIVIFSI